MEKRRWKSYGWHGSDRVLVPTPDRKNTIEKYIRTYEIAVTVQRNARYFYIDIYPMKFVDEKMKGYNYSIEAEVGMKKVGFYDYYMDTGNYFRTFKEAKEAALKKALKMKFPKTNIKVKVQSRTTMSKWKRKNKEVSIEGKKKTIPIYTRIIHPFWYEFIDSSPHGGGTITLYVTVEPTKNSEYKLWHYTIEVLTDKRTPDEKRKKIAYLDSERDKQLVFKTSTEARKAVMKAWDDWLHSISRWGIKGWSKVYIDIEK